MLSASARPMLVLLLLPLPLQAQDDDYSRSCQKVCKRDQAALLIPSLVVASSWIGFPSWYLRPA